MSYFIDLGSTVLLKEKVYKFLKTQIIIGQLKPGNPLNIQELATSMNISVAPIREALNMLSKDGLVILNPRKQAVVADPTSENWKILIDLRKMVEPYSAKISIKNIPQKKIDEVQTLLEAVLENPSDYYQYIESDMAIHELFYLYAGSTVLTDIVTNIRDHTLRMRYFAEKFEDDNSKEKINITIQSTQEHLKILQAINERDGDKVYNLVLEHIKNYVERMNHAISSN